jgi:alpha-L-rhamnosidase
MYKTLLVTCFYLFFLGKIIAQTSSLNISNIRVEYKSNAFIQNTTPRLSWELLSKERGQKQTAYQILVSSTENLLSESKANLWNSGKILSNSTNQISYAGKALTSRDICYFKIRIWDKNNVASNWSTISKWEIGISVNALSCTPNILFFIESKVTKPVSCINSFW